VRDRPSVPRVREAVRELSGWTTRCSRAGACARGRGGAGHGGHRIDLDHRRRDCRLRRTARGAAALGAYGWVDDLSPATDPTPPTTAGCSTPGPRRRWRQRAARPRGARRRRAGRSPPART
jgi:hypothetical protein